MKRTTIDQLDVIEFSHSFSKYLFHVLVTFIVIDLLSVPFYVFRLYISLLF